MGKAKGVARKQRKERKNRANKARPAPRPHPPGPFPPPPAPHPPAPAAPPAEPHPRSPTPPACRLPLAAPPRCPLAALAAHCSHGRQRAESCPDLVWRFAHRAARSRQVRGLKKAKTLGAA